MTIAILSTDFHRTIQWAKDNLDVEMINITQRTIRDKSGKQYIIIQNEQQARGLRLDEYVRAPDFYTLEDVVRERVFK